MKHVSNPESDEETDRQNITYSSVSNIKSQWDIGVVRNYFKGEVH